METKYAVVLGSPVDLSTTDWFSLSIALRPHPSILYIENFQLQLQVRALLKQTQF